VPPSQIRPDFRRGQGHSARRSRPSRILPDSSKEQVSESVAWAPATKKTNKHGVFVDAQSNDRIVPSDQRDGAGSRVGKSGNHRWDQGDGTGQGDIYQGDGGQGGNDQPEQGNGRGKLESDSLAFT
jgi:hypothetical protein